MELIKSYIESLKEEGITLSGAATGLYIGRLDGECCLLHYDKHDFSRSIRLLPKYSNHHTPLSSYVSIWENDRRRELEEQFQTNWRATYALNIILGDLSDNILGNIFVPGLISTNTVFPREALLDPSLINNGLFFYYPSGRYNTPMFLYIKDFIPFDLQFATIETEVRALLKAILDGRDIVHEDVFFIRIEMNNPLSTFFEEYGLTKERM